MKKILPLLFLLGLCHAEMDRATNHYQITIGKSAGTVTNTTDAWRLIDSSTVSGDLGCFGIQTDEGSANLRGKICGGMAAGGGSSGKLAFSTRTTSGTMVQALQIDHHQNLHFYDSLIVDSLAAFSKNVTVAGTLGVTGLATVGGTLGVTGLSTFTGVIGIGTAPSTDIASQLNFTMVSASVDQYGYYSRLIASSSATNSGNAAYLQVRSAAASYHMKMGYGAEIGNGVAGATSTIDTLVGVHIEAQTAGATKNYAIETLGGKNFFGDTVVVAGKTAVTSGGSTVGIVFGSTGGPEIRFGSGVPTIAAPKGSLYLRTDGTSTSTRMYVNTDGSTTWTNVTTGG